MSIQIPCPQCGRELKLPDRTLLGRKGKCPKCGHTFILEEPPAVTLELAGPDSVSGGVQVMPGIRTTPSFLSSAPATNAQASVPGPVVAPEFAALENVAKPKGAAARLKELQKKNARRRNIGIAVSAVILVAVGLVVMYAPQFAAKRPEQSSTQEEVASTENPAATEGGHSGDGPDPSATEFAQLGSPTKGNPIELKYIPFGTQVAINLHPAELWKEASLGEEIRYCIPPIAKFVEATLNDLFKRKPEQVEELFICLIPGPRGSMPDVAAVARMVDEQKRSQLIEQFGQRVDTFEYPVYMSGERAYMIVDQKTLVVGPKAQAQEMVQAITQSHPSDLIDPLLPLTDRDRHVTLIFTPMTLGLQDTWFPENFRPFVKSSLEWLGEDTSTMVWSFHLTDELFYSEILLKSKGVPPKKFEKEYREKLSKLAGTLVPAIEQMNPKEQGKRMVIGRVPAMIEVFSMATIIHQKPPHIQLITPLPDRAASNMVLGTLLAWDESTRTEFTKAKPASTESSKIPAMVADRLKLKIDVDFRAMPLNEAFAFIGGEIKTQIDIDGDGLKLGGFTKNIKQEYRMDGTPAKDVILKIFDVSKGINAVDPTKNLVLIVDEAKKSILVTTTAAAERKGLVPFVLTK